MDDSEIELTGEKDELMTLLKDTGAIEISES
jgi:hypothetical protein